jgi:peptidoglycan/LPS O-acetylase OafA/YrhL
LESRLKPLDSLRGIAALVVVFYHCTITYYPLGLPVWIKYSPLSVLVDGVDAVSIFFALSGFVLFLRLEDPGRFRYLPYIVKRFMRLYPPFAAVILGSAVVYYLVKPQGIPPPTAALVAGTLAMTDKGSLQVLDPAMWSLVQEVRISIVFPLLAFCVRQNWYLTTIATLIASVASDYAVFSHPTGLLYDPIQTMRCVFLFAGGAALSLNAQIVRRHLGKTPRWSKAALWVAALAVIGLAMNVVIAEYAALIVVALCLDPELDTVLGHGFAAWLGRISYSLYLVHEPVLTTLVNIFSRKVPLHFILVWALLLSVLIADLAYRTIEKPSMGLGRRLARSLTAPDRRRRA